MNTKVSLYNKRVLFIAPNFFNYELEIINEINSMGAQVDFVVDRPFNSNFLKAITRLKRNWVAPLLNSYYKKTIFNFNRDNYDYVFVINGEALSKELLLSLKKKYREATFILYIWDALKNKKTLEKNLYLYDKLYSFDPIDAEYFKMNYRPLFFGKSFLKNIEKEKYKYDFSFVGTAHSDRYEIITNFIKHLPKTSNYFTFFYLQTKWVFFIRKLFTSSFKGANLKDFSFSPLSKDTINEIYNNSLAVFDIEHPGQLGLTMRSIEALGSQKKLITTNDNIAKESFYNPNNILIINRYNLKDIPPEFFSTKYQPVSDIIYKKYSIQGWIEEIFR